jgi:hypothetical protein
MHRGHKLAMKLYRKHVYTGRYLHFKSSDSYRVKKEVVRSLINRANVICQDQKDFNKEIKNIRRDIILNEYPQGFVDSVKKPLRSNCRSSDTIYRDTVTISHVNGISEKFRSIWNSFNVRTTFETKHTLRGTLMKSGPVRDCGRCYISETRRPLEWRIKEYKYNLT